MIEFDFLSELFLFLAVPETSPPSGSNLRKANESKETMFALALMFKYLFEALAKPQPKGYSISLPSY